MTTAHDRLMLDLFTTALEGGIGYWAECHSYHWMIGPPADDVEPETDYNGFYADITERDYEDDGAADHRINRQTLIRGYNRAISPEWRDRLHWSSGEKPPYVVTDDTDWDFDAGDADMIVQLGLFNEIIYG
jgi:hypothetical protein